MNNNKIETTLIQIIPEYLNLKSYNRDKLNEHTITILNNCNVPLILFLSSSDSNILLLKESSIKIGKKQKKSISFIIKDKNFSKIKKFSGKPKKVYIFIKNDLIEEKFEITLSYYCYENSLLSEIKRGKNNGLLSFNTKTKYRFNSNGNRPKKIIPKNIKKVNLNKIIKNKMKSEVISNFGFNENLNSFNFINEDEKMTESQYLSNAVQDLRNQILYLKQMLKHSQMKIQQLQIQKDNYFNNLTEEKCISFFVNADFFDNIYNKRYGFSGGKEDLYEYENLILKDENEKLVRMVKYLEKKLLYFQQYYQNQNNNYNRNKNYIINNYNYN